MSSSQPLQWMRSAAPDGGGRQATAPCAMCGIELPTGAMLPDGGQACADVRWYCRDTAACTKRWTERQPAPMLLSRREPAGGQPRRGEPGHEWAEGQAGGQTGHAEPGHEWAGGPDGGQPGHAEPGHEWAGGPDGGQTGHAEPGHVWAGGPDGGQPGHAEPGHEWAGGPLTGTPGGD